MLRVLQPHSKGFSRDIRGGTQGFLQDARGATKVYSGMVWEHWRGGKAMGTHVRVIKGLVRACRARVSRSRVY
jgi:hypothetical protein